MHSKQINKSNIRCLSRRKREKGFFGREIKSTLCTLIKVVRLLCSLNDRGHNNAISRVSCSPRRWDFLNREDPFHCSTGWNTLAWKAPDAIGNEVSSRLNNPRCVLREIDTRGGWNFAQQIYRRPCGFTVCDSRSLATHDRPARNIVMVSGRRLTPRLVCGIILHKFHLASYAFSGTSCSARLKSSLWNIGLQVSSIGVDICFIGWSWY